MSVILSHTYVVVLVECPQHRGVLCYYHTSVFSKCPQYIGR